MPKPVLKRWRLLNLSLLLLVIAGCAEKPIAHNHNPVVKNAVTITIDLCPSSKPYEAKLFKTLEGLGQKAGQPLPVTVFVSGRWLEKHRIELRKIKKMYLAITWGNHSYSHPIADDFLDSKRANFRQEVLKNISAMKKFGLMPSKYFRFPGLRHNHERLKELKALGYIAVDSNAWLGKTHWWHRTVGGKIKDGSIILIHGNGNEKPGVVDEFIAWLKHNKKYRLAPLADFMPVAVPSGTPEAVQP
jgi:peptidoglycan/xylan/chitin deacetylase (PgdA/CDA1 family)